MLGQCGLPAWAASCKPGVADMKTKWSKFERVFYRCPGAWLGNEPGKFSATGNITVNVERLFEALAYLRRYFVVSNPRLSVRERNGLILDVQWKERGK